MYPEYKSDSYMFRQLSPDEVESFADYAVKNDPPTGNWALYHPACRKVWYARGLRPDESAGIGRQP